MTETQSWEAENDRDLLRLLIGDDFGPAPETRLADIRATKESWAQELAVILGLAPSDALLEVGSGCGMLASHLARHVREYHGVDISESFIRFARRECAELRNATFHHVAGGPDFSPLGSGTIDVAFANSVFIHFNLFDIHGCLAGLQRVVRMGGRLWFDIAVCDDYTFDPARTRYFAEHAAHYRANPASKTVMQWNSARAVLTVARHHGFELVRAPMSARLAAFGRRAHERVVSRLRLAEPSTEERSSVVGFLFRRVR